MNVPVIDTLGNESDTDVEMRCERVAPEIDMVGRVGDGSKSESVTVVVIDMDCDALCVLDMVSASDLVAPDGEAVGEREKEIVAVGVGKTVSEADGCSVVDKLRLPSLTVSVKPLGETDDEFDNDIVPEIDTVCDGRLTVWKPCDGVNDDVSERVTLCDKVSVDDVDSENVWRSIPPPPVSVGEGEGSKVSDG